MTEYPTLQINTKMEGSAANPIDLTCEVLVLTGIFETDTEIQLYVKDLNSGIDYIYHYPKDANGNVRI
tara:strand:+ start:729 stop:932 length:204 start_codon:yes stop_codon:yes gene_type:complete